MRKPVLWAHSTGFTYVAHFKGDWDPYRLKMPFVHMVLLKPSKISTYINYIFIDKKCPNPL